LSYSPKSIYNFSLKRGKIQGGLALDFT